MVNPTDIESAHTKFHKNPLHIGKYTQYCAIKNGLIKNSTGIFGNFKERVLKIFRIKNRFFSLRKIKERSILRIWKVSEKFGKYPKNSEKIQIFWKKSKFFGKFQKNPKVFEKIQKIKERYSRIKKREYWKNLEI